MQRRPVWSIGMALAVCALWMLAGCSRPAPPPNPVGQGPSGGFTESPSGGTSASPPVLAAPGPAPQYVDFPDIPLPAEMKIDQKDSIVFQSGAFKAGVLTLRGRVDLKSVIDFFQTVMPREGWKPRGGFSYRRSVLIFEKPDKTCVIKIFEDIYYTYVEVYVAPVQGSM